MKTILVENYQCDYCNQVFNKKFECVDHEFNEHICPNCEHCIKNEREQFTCNAKNKCEYKKVEKTIKKSDAEYCDEENLRILNKW